MYLAILSRGVVTVVLAAAFVSVLLLITFDLDRPTRGLVTVPDTPLVSLRASMAMAQPTPRMVGTEASVRSRVLMPAKNSDIAKSTTDSV